MGILVLNIGLVILALLGVIIEYRAKKLRTLLKKMVHEAFDYLRKENYRAFAAIKRDGDYSLFNQLEIDRKVLYSELDKLINSSTSILWSFRPISRKDLCGSILKIIEDKKD
jgi:hypothetical protein